MERAVAQAREQAGKEARHRCVGFCGCGMWHSNVFTPTDDAGHHQINESIHPSIRSTIVHPITPIHCTHRALADVRERVQQEKAKYEAEIVELYRRRLKEVRSCAL